MSPPSRWSKAARRRREVDALRASDAAAAAGIGTCWGGYYQLAAMSYEPLQKALAFGDGMKCYGAMMFGYPGIHYSTIPARNPADVSWL